DCMRGGDRALELLERAVDQGAVRPRAGMRDVEMVARRLRLEAGGAVRRDAVAEAAVGALELAGLAGLLRQLLVAPDAVDQYAHYSVPTVVMRHQNLRSPCT